MNLLSAEGLVCYLTRPWWDELNFTLRPGEWMCLQADHRQCRETFDVLSGLHKPDEGRLLLGMESLYECSEAKQAMLRLVWLGAVPEGKCFLPGLRLIDQLVLPMRMAGMTRQEAIAQIQRTVKGLLPMHTLYNTPNRCCPQTLALAKILRASVLGQKVQLLDRCFEYMDYKDKQVIWRALQEWIPEDSALIYFSSGPAPKEIDWTYQRCL